MKDRLKDSLAFRRLPGTNAQRLLLTFDDGPHPSVTPAVLDLLDQYQARAIFFIVGHRIPRAPEMLSEILRRGHLLGNHTFAHNPQLALSPYLRDLRQTQAAIAAIAGAPARFFRPPEGRLTLPAILAPRFLLLPTLLWSVDSHDYRLRSPDQARLCYQDLVNHFRLHGLNRDILLFHDDNLHTPLVLESLLPQLAELGADLSSGLPSLTGERS